MQHRWEIEEEKSATNFLFGHSLTLRYCSTLTWSPLLTSCVNVYLLDFMNAGVWNFHLYVAGGNPSETLYLHYALEIGWRMESNPAEPFWFDQASLWNQLCWNSSSSGSCKLQAKEDILFWPSVFRGGTPTRIQTLPSNAGERCSGLALICCVGDLFHSFKPNIPFLVLLTVEILKIFS